MTNQTTCPRCHKEAEDLGHDKFACWNTKCHIGEFEIRTKTFKKITEYVLGVMHDL